MATDETASAPPLGQRPNEPVPGKDSLANPQGYSEDGKGTCPDCGLPFGEHPEFHSHGGPRGGDSLDGAALPGKELDPELGGDPAEA
ncbi:MAG: hypothetical protein QOJ26_902 [Thermoplasmata archaeon]|jgi:hypothetical protein|nr:hypothetical protein [Thermoplasmata archaeon]MEA3166033.1 hypothetical protein [Thermoplasmata archaeon]